MPTAQVSADMRKMRQTLAIAPSGNTPLATTSVPADIIEMWKAEIAALSVRKRKIWKGRMVDRSGVRGVVVYDPLGLEVPGYGHTHFKQRMNEQKKGMYATEQEWRPVMPSGCPSPGGAYGEVRTWGHTLARVTYFGESIFSCGGSGHFRHIKKYFRQSTSLLPKYGPRSGHPQRPP